MRMLIVVGLLAVACGGSSVQSVNPAGTWTVTDTLDMASSRAGCAPSATETLTVVGEAIQGYAMTASYCDGHSCELQGDVGDVFRDVAFYADHTAGGTRSQGWDPVSRTGCFYSTVGQRAH